MSTGSDDRAPIGVGNLAGSQPFQRDGPQGLFETAVEEGEMPDFRLPD